MLNLPSQDERVQFLVEELQTRHHSTSQPRVANWLVNQLCDSGRVDTLPIVSAYIREEEAGYPRGEQRIDFCRQRMEVIASRPERVQALASMLTLNATEENQKLYAWAYYSLLEIGSDAALAAVDRFVAQANSVAAGHPSKRILYHHTVDIRSARSSRRPVKLQ